MKKKIFIITGEYSGDIHASNVVKYLNQITSDYIFEGIGGDNMEKQGVKLFEHTKNLSAVGISPKIIFNHYRLGKRVVEYLKNDYKPDLVLLVDYGGFNLSVAKFLHQAGIKIFYYIPPQVWASRKWRIKYIKKFVDKVLCIFPFEVNMYKEYGIDVHYCGHPLIKQLPPKADRESFFKKHNLDLTRPLVSVFPGSRSLELKFLADKLIGGAKKLQKKHPEIQICISHAPSLSDDVFDKYINDSELKIIKGENQALLSVSDALILASGTVALEAALYQVPMIIAYGGPWILYFAYLMLRCINKVSLPNIITGEDIVPELIQTKFTKHNICYETERLLYDKNYRADIIERLGHTRGKLSDKYSADEVANCIVNVL